MAGAQRAGLSLGPQTRSQRATLRQAIAEGSVDVRALLLGDGRPEHEEIALGMTLQQLLGAIPGVGEVVLSNICTTARLSPQKRLGSLPHQRRRELAAAIEQEAT